MVFNEGTTPDGKEYCEAIVCDVLTYLVQADSAGRWYAYKITNTAVVPVYTADYEADGNSKHIAIVHPSKEIAIDWLKKYVGGVK